MRWFIRILIRSFPVILFLVFLYCLAKFTNFFNQLESNIYAEIVSLFANSVLIVFFIELWKKISSIKKNFAHRYVITMKSYYYMNKLLDEIFSFLNIDFLKSTDELESDIFYSIDDSIDKGLKAKIHVLINESNKEKAFTVLQSDLSLLLKKISELNHEIARVSVGYDTSNKIFKVKNAFDLIETKFQSEPIPMRQFIWLKSQFQRNIVDNASIDDDIEDTNIYMHKRLLPEVAKLIDELYWVYNFENLELSLRRYYINYGALSASQNTIKILMWARKYNRMQQKYRRENKKNTS